MVVFGLEMEFWVMVAEHPLNDFFLLSFPCMNALDIHIDSGNLIATCHISLKHAKTMSYNVMSRSYTLYEPEAFASKVSAKTHIYTKAKVDDSLKVKGRLEALQFARERLSPDLPPLVSTCSQIEKTPMAATTFHELALSSESEVEYSSTDSDEPAEPMADDIVTDSSDDELRTLPKAFDSDSDSTNSTISRRVKRKSQKFRQKEREILGQMTVEDELRKQKKAYDKSMSTFFMRTSKLNPSHAEFAVVWHTMSNTFIAPGETGHVRVKYAYEGTPVICSISILQSTAENHCLRLVQRKTGLKFKIFQPCPLLSSAAFDYVLAQRFMRPKNSKLQEAVIKL